MSWARFDDDMLDHPKVIEAGGPGFALNAAAIIWCARNLTDGFIPARQVPRLLDLSEFKVPLRELLERLTKGTHGPLWEYDDARKGYVIHDYLDYNPSRADVEHEREQARIRQGRSRTSRRESRRDAGVTHAVNNGPVTGAPVPVPVPEDLNLSPVSESVADPPDPGLSHHATRAPESPAEPASVADLQQRFVEARNAEGDTLIDPKAEWEKFRRYYAKHPPGPGAPWHRLVDSWLNNIAEKGFCEAGERRRGPRRVDRPAGEPTGLGQILSAALDKARGGG